MGVSILFNFRLKTNWAKVCHPSCNVAKYDALQTQINESFQEKKKEEKRRNKWTNTIYVGEAMRLFSLKSLCQSKLEIVPFPRYISITKPKGQKDMRNKLEPKVNR